MATLLDSAKDAYRRKAVPGDAASADHEPSKSDVIALWAMLQAALEAIGTAASVSVVKTTRAALNGDLAHAAAVVALVHSDATADNNGLYVKIGASGAGSWERRFQFESAWAAAISALEADVDGLLAEVATSRGGEVSLNARLEKMAAIGQHVGKRVTVVAAATVDLGALVGDYVVISGTPLTSVTSFGTAPAGIERTIRFGVSTTVVHDNTSMVLIGGTNIQAVAGDIAVMRSEGNGNWRCLDFMRASGRALIEPTPAQIGASTQASLDALAAATVARQSRPGDQPAYWTANLNGPPESLPPLGANVVATANGRVVRVTGPAIVAAIEAVRIEPGRVYQMRWAVRRPADSPDPAGDAISARLRWLDQNFAALTPATAIVRTWTTEATVAAGRLVHSALISTLETEGVTVVAPGPCYVRRYVQTFGSADVQTDVEMIEWEDVTDTLGGAVLVEDLTEDFNALRDEVIEARGGEETLDARLDEMAGAIGGVTSSVRATLAQMLARLGADDDAAGHAAALEAFLADATLTHLEWGGQTFEGPFSYTMMTGRPDKTIDFGSALLRKAGDLPVIEITVPARWTSEIVGVTRVDASLFETGSYNTTLTDRLTISPARSLTRGDVLKVFANDLLPASQQYAGGADDRRIRKGEMAVSALTTNGTAVTLTAPLKDTYTSAPKVAALDTTRITIIGGVVDYASGAESSTSNFPVVRIQNAVGPRVIGMSARRSFGPVIAFRGCLMPECMPDLGRRLVNRPEDNAFGYLVWDMACEGGRYAGLRTIDSRHPMTTSYSACPPDSPDMWLYGRPRNTSMSDIISFGGSNTAANSHPEGEDVHIDGVQASAIYAGARSGGSAIAARGWRPRITRCSSYNCRTHVTISCFEVGVVSGVSGRGATENALVVTPELTKTYDVDGTTLIDEYFDVHGRIEDADLELVMQAGSGNLVYGSSRQRPDGSWAQMHLDMRRVTLRLRGTGEFRRAFYMESLHLTGDEITIDLTEFAGTMHPEATIFGMVDDRCSIDISRLVIKAGSHQLKSLVINPATPPASSTVRIRDVLWIGDLDIGTVGERTDGNPFLARFDQFPTQEIAGKKIISGVENSSQIHSRGAINGTSDSTQTFWRGVLAEDATILVSGGADAVAPSLGAAKPGVMVTISNQSSTWRQECSDPVFSLPPRSSVTFVMDDASTWRRISRPQLPAVASRAGGYTLQQGDHGDVILAPSGTITLPATFPIGWWCDVISSGSAFTPFVAASGGSIAGPTRTRGPHAHVRLMVVSNSGGSAAVWRVMGDTPLAQSAGGGTLDVGTIEDDVTLTGASVAPATSIPAEVVVMAVSVRVLTAVTGPAAYTVGVSGDAGRYMTEGPLTLGAYKTGLGPHAYAVATPLAIASGGGNFTGGTLRVTTYFLRPTPPAP